MLALTRPAELDTGDPPEPRGVGWIGLCVIGVGAVLVGYAAHAAIWFSLPQPSAPETFGMIGADYPELGRLESDYLDAGPYLVLLLVMAVSVLACFLHRHRVMTAVASLVGGMLAAGLAGLFVYGVFNAARPFDLAPYLSAGPFLAIGGYLLVGVGGVIGAIEVRHAEPWD